MICRAPTLRLLLFFTLAAVIVAMPAAAQVSLPTSVPGSLTTSGDYLRSSRLGITFINSAEHPISEQRYQQALYLGAGWNRWPLYWNKVETSQGNLNWWQYDQLVAADLAHGFQINAILLGRPSFYTTGVSITGLQAPIFSDGSDLPAPGKAINPGNPWAVFVYQAVTRYMPGGLLAQQMGWGPGQGIRIWEAWNEPDLPMFWNSSFYEYARLLKVTYIVAHYADPQARVMFGGLAYINPAGSDYLAWVLALYAQDPLREQFNWFMDIVGVHSYSYPRGSSEVVQRAKANLANYGLQRPVWLNENGVPVWDDYPGPTWAAALPQSRVYRATMQQQAAYIIQSAAYAWAAGAEVVMYHQLYDDCGNQRSGTDFAPHNGDLCSGQQCYGDAHGLFRNPRGSICFSQHPLPGTYRPSALAYHTLGEVFGAGSFEGGQIQLIDQAVVITFLRPAAGERISVIWNRALQGISINLAANSQKAELHTFEGQSFALEPVDGHYTLSLAPATRDDFPYLTAGDYSGIGGPPYILVEKPEARVLVSNPALPQFSPDTSGELSVPLLLTTPAPGPTETPRATADPSQDKTPPITTMTPLPEVSPPDFTVSWSAQDDGGIESYIIWVRVDDGGWQPWLATVETQAVYQGERGKRYTFAVWAADLAGNWSRNIDLEPQAQTRVE